MKIDPYIFPMMSIIISDGKEHAENTGKQPDLMGLSKKSTQNHHLFLKLPLEYFVFWPKVSVTYTWGLNLLWGKCVHAFGTEAV